MSHFEKILSREDGSKAKILVLGCSAPFATKQTYETCIFSRASNESDWERILDTPELREKAQAMSVDTFIREGRHPMFSVVSAIEVMVAMSEAMEA